MPESEPPRTYFISEKQASEGNRKRCAAFHLIFYSLKFYELAKRSYTVKWCFSSKSAKTKKKQRYWCARQWLQSGSHTLPVENKLVQPLRKAIWQYLLKWQLHIQIKMI